MIDKSVRASFLTCPGTNISWAKESQAACLGTATFKRKRGAHFGGVVPLFRAGPLGRVPFWGILVQGVTNPLLGGVTWRQSKYKGLDEHPYRDPYTNKDRLGLNAF